MVLHGDFVAHAVFFRGPGPRPHWRNQFTVIIFRQAATSFRLIYGNTAWPDRFFFRPRFYVLIKIDLFSNGQPEKKGNDR